MHRRFSLLSTLVLPVLLLAGCGGGSSSPTPVTPPAPPVPPTQVSISGAAVKGPLAGAVVTAFAVDTAAIDWKGTEIDTGATDSTAAIIDLQIPEDTSGLILLEFSADADTVDITTNAAPRISVLKTIVDASRILAGDDIYATPLTSLATDVAAVNSDSAGLFGGDGDGVTSTEEAVMALAVAGQQIASTLGFSLIDGVDIFSASPLLSADTDTSDEQAAVAGYRTAIEAASALIVAITDESLAANPASELTADMVLSALASDLSDGIIDGIADNVAVAELADVADLDAVIGQDPLLLTIPGSETLVGDIEAVLIEELATTGVTVDTAPLADGTASADPVPASTVPDSDNDSVRDDSDNCVATANGDQLNSDGDEQGNLCDDDDDNDQVADANDAFPLNPEESVDSDGDGTGNNGDPDDDNDSVADADDAFPLDASESVDTDSDGVGNNTDTNDDGDDALDEDDAFPIDATETTDTDGDGTGNNADSDDDNDQVNDDDDAFPLDVNEFVDSDGDGTGNNGDTDDDNDGTPDVSDAFPLDSSEAFDTDGDGTGNNADGDDDGDGVNDEDDAFPLDEAETADLDADGIGDNQDTDDDGDGIDDETDNCPTIENPDQVDTSNNGIGDACTGDANWDQFFWNGANWQ